MNAATAPVASYQSDYDAIIDLLNEYFEGLYEGDVDKLRAIFHDDAWLKGNDYRKARDEWLDAVASRPVPSGRSISSPAPISWKRRELGPTSFAR